MQLFRNSHITSPTYFSYSFLQFSIFSSNSKWIIMLRPLPVSRMSFRSGLSFYFALISKHVQLAVQIWLKALSTVSQQIIQFTVLMSFQILKEEAFLFQRSQQQLFLYLLPKVLIQVQTRSFNFVNSSLLVTIIFYSSIYTCLSQSVTYSSTQDSELIYQLNSALFNSAKHFTFQKARITRQLSCYYSFILSIVLIEERMLPSQDFDYCKLFFDEKNFRQRYSV